MPRTRQPAARFVPGGQVHELEQQLRTLEAERTRHETELRRLAALGEGDFDNLPPAERRAVEDHLQAQEEAIGNIAVVRDHLAGHARILEAFERSGGQIGDNSQAPWARQVPEGPGGHYDRARRNIDHAVRAGHLPDHAAENVTALIESARPSELDLASRWAAAAGDPEYRGAFAKLCADPDRGHLLWTASEAAAFRATEEVRTAMSTTGANGGYMIPLTLDPAIMLTNDGSINPLRQVSRVVRTTTNAWQGVTSAGATAEWKAEADEAGDGSPSLGNPSIPVFSGDVFVPFSFEVGMDAVNFLEELALVCADAADNLMAAAYTTGNGSTAPQGVITGLSGTSSKINTTGSEAIDDSDPYTLQNALPARFSSNAVFMSHIAIGNGYRQMETTNGAILFPELRQNPPYLLGKRWLENSNMDGTINPAATADNYVLLYGDFGKGFIIVDRIGTTMELIPNLFSTTSGRPTGQRGAFMFFRTGSEVVVPQALRLLDVPTAA